MTYYLSKLKINYHEINLRRAQMAVFYPEANCELINGEYVIVPITGPDYTLFLEKSSITFDIDDGFIRDEDGLYQKEFEAWKNNKYQGSIWNYLNANKSISKTDSMEF